MEIFYAFPVFFLYQTLPPDSYALKGSTSFPAFLFIRFLRLYGEYAV